MPHVIQNHLVDHFQQKEEDPQPSSIPQWLPPQVRISDTLLHGLYVVCVLSRGELFPWEVPVAICKESQLPQEWLYLYSSVSPVQNEPVTRTCQLLEYFDIYN